MYRLLVPTNSILSPVPLYNFLGEKYKLFTLGGRFTCLRLIRLFVFVLQVFENLKIPTSAYLQFTNKIMWIINFADINLL